MRSVPPHSSPSTGVPALPERPEGAPPRPRRSGPRWPAWTAPVALLSAFAVTILVGGMVAVAVGAPSSPDEAADQPGLNLVLTLVQDAALISVALVFARMVARPWPRDFGLRATRLWPGVGWALLTVVAFLATSMVLALALGVEEESTDEVLNTLGVDEGGLLFVAAALLVCVVAPIVEEVFFRGYFFTALRTSMGVAAAATITGLVFGSIHITNFLGDAGSDELIAGVVALSIFGGALCLLYVRTGSLYPCIGAHAINNTLAFSVAQGFAVLEVVALFAGTAVVTAGVLWPFHRMRPPPAGAPAPAAA